MAKTMDIEIHNKTHKMLRKRIEKNRQYLSGHDADGFYILRSLDTIKKRIRKTQEAITLGKDRKKRIKTPESIDQYKEELKILKQQRKALKELKKEMKARA